MPSVSVYGICNMCSNSNVHKFVLVRVYYNIIIRVMILIIVHNNLVYYIKSELILTLEEIEHAWTSPKANALVTIPL